jgi:site-specific DNA-methyltransferase (adenine-specific)
MIKSYSSTYNPDVLSTLANLSSDEVFTPPHIVNQMLDMLPQELFSDKTTTFLDPATKSGVFLREITKRLIKGLEIEFPDLQERLDHILHNQVFGIAITELTSLLSRRSLYCSKYPNSKFSLSVFETNEGNIKYGNIKHTWSNNRCIYCGANKKEYEKLETLESYAYNFIHDYSESELTQMKFDVIVGNPPYQLSDGGAQASARPIYNLFVDKAIELNPKFIVMITPSRWFNGGRGLDDFRIKMLSDNRIRQIHDFPNSNELFSNVDIKGGVNYFLWDRNNRGLCKVTTYINGKIESIATRSLAELGSEVFIRNNNLVSIFQKVYTTSKEKKLYSFSKIVSALRPFGFRGDFIKNPQKYGLPPISEKKIEGYLVLHGLDESQKRVTRYLPKEYPIPKNEFLEDYKIFFARNQGIGTFGERFSEPIFAQPGELCTETYVVIGPFPSMREAENCWDYMKTKFFRTLLGLRKSDQNASRSVYKEIPLMNFKKIWTDNELYSFFNLSDSDIDFIENNVIDYKS